MAVGVAGGGGGGPGLVSDPMKTKDVMTEERFRALVAERLRWFKPEELLTRGAGHSGGRCAGLNAEPFPPDVLENLLRAGEAADAVREEYGGGLRVLSGWRGGAYNRCIGGATASLHLRGMALDLAPVGGSPGAVARLHGAAVAVRSRGVFAGGIGRYGTFVHIDIRGANVDWRG